MSYIGVQPVTRATRVRTFGALASATTTIAIPGGFSPSNIEVFIDGLYVQPTDYNDSDGFNLVFITTLALGTEYVVMEARNFEVANHYTKQEIQNAAFDFNTMPTVGGDPVVESGSNVDGAFTKWADGTLICIMTFTGYTTVQVDTTTSATFIAAPDSAPNSIFPGTANDFGVSWGSSTTSVAFKSNQSYAANKVTLTAIGRWK
jgi:hypothetical protein